MISNKTAENLEVGDIIVLGGSSYEVDHIQWNGKKHQYLVTYNKGQLIWCKRTDELTVIT